jgi:hypothetical protein
LGKDRIIHHRASEITEKKSKNEGRGFVKPTGPDSVVGSVGPPDFLRVFSVSSEALW